MLKQLGVLVFLVVFFLFQFFAYKANKYVKKELRQDKKNVLPMRADKYENPKGIIYRTLAIAMWFLWGIFLIIFAFYS